MTADDEITRFVTSLQTYPIDTGSAIVDYVMIKPTDLEGKLRDFLKRYDRGMQIGNHNTQFNTFS